MKNKRKIWVRIGAFMAALICCVLCVVPAYAEETEAAEEDLAATIAEQQEKLNRMLRPFGYEIDYDAYLQSVGKTYHDIVAVGEIDSDFPTLGRNNTDWTNDSFYSNFVVWVDLRNNANEVVWSRSNLAIEYIGMSIPLTAEDAYTSFRYGSGNGQFIRMYFDPNGNWTKFSVGTSSGYTNYLCSDGYHFSVEYISTDNKYNPYFGVICSRTWTANPAMLLSLDVSAGNDEIYNQGYLHGYEIGYFDGETYGYDGGLVAGREEGYTEGDADGYRRGYDDGMNQTSLIEGIKSLFRAPMEFIESVLDFEIFGIDLGDAVKALVSMMLLALVITVVWKAVK